MKSTRALPTLAGALLLCACDGTYLGTSVGVGSGGVGGGVGVGTGVRLGGGGGGVFLGTGLGGPGPADDRLFAEGAAARALETQPSGTAVTWSNPDNGHSGTVKPLNSFKAADGRDCRDFEQTVTIGGRTEAARGSACRTAEGAWKPAGPR